MVGMGGGSHFLFWRCPREFQLAIQDSQRQWQLVPWPIFVQPQREVKQEDGAQKEKWKLTKARRRRYISADKVKILTHYLSVTKVEDIRVVCNGTSTVLNEVIWSPHFFYPMFRSKLRATQKGIYVVDRDIGEIFLYFMLIKYIRPYCRVVVSNAITEEECEYGRLEGW